jgi:hypothetical protein
VALPCEDDRIIEETVAAEADSGKQIQRPGGVFGREMERRRRSICRRGAMSKGARNRRELKGGGDHVGGVSARNFWSEEVDDDVALAGGSR